eukprot:PLAT9019.1.p1 GENE.PLAT9019.1~~PLAT9019.1.p1  ORF type:complete len:268 (+),score=82.26 PLAT9019.1:75-878(+)
MFAGKRVIVSGGSAGIGRVLVRKLLAEGATVALVSRTLSKLKETVPAGYDDRAICIAADLSTVDGCNTAMRRCLDGLGGQLDVLVCNAGAGDMAATIETTTAKQFAEHMNLLVRAPLLMTQLALPALKASRGNVVHVSSIAAQLALPSVLPYCIAKAALDALTRNSALALAKSGVRVNAVAPATVATEFHVRAGMSSEKTAEYYRRGGELHPLGRIGSSEEIADLIMFMASERAEWITGQIWVADGGRTLTSAQSALFGKKAARSKL